METIRVRFIEKKRHFFIQRRTWYGCWKYIGINVNYGGGSCFSFYSQDDKESLLNEVIKDYYGLHKDIVRVIEYPTIKIY